jgi:nitroimidazol reductase NimA-like FMN-containing flavoprotein (pyridoxamine 5'-phosphate oxidase superfamily)
MPKPIEPLPNRAECERMITASPVGVLVMCSSLEPYAVPMNHAYSAGTLYFHCAPTGRKLDMIRANPRVCYVVNRDFGEPGALADSRKCHGNWESVIAQGRARVIDDPEELRSAFLMFGRYFNPDFTLEESALQTTSAIIVEVDSMTARREMPSEGVTYWSWSPGRP